MKILYFSPHPHLNLASPSGPGTHMREVIAGFRARGHEVKTFIVGGESLRQVGLQIAFKQRWYKKWLPASLWQTGKDFSLLRKDKALKAELANLINEFKPDLVYERGYYLMTSGVDVCQRIGVKHYLELNAPYPQEKRDMEGWSALGFWAKKAERKQVRTTTKLVVVSSALKSYFIERTGVNEEKILITPNAVNPQKIVASGSLSRSDLNLKEEDWVVGFVGSIFPYHGVDLLIEAVAELNMNDRSVRMKALIVGDGEILPALKKLAQDRGVSNDVLFTGNVHHESVYDYISLMDVAVMPKSNWYGSPVKIFEYGAMGKLVIAPNNGPVRDVMEQDEDGLLVDGSKEGLVHALSFCMNHPVSADRMAQRFQARVLTEFTWQNVADSILKA
jgi:glycosyltransferase involved in cell wall biosynthesis